MGIDTPTYAKYPIRFRALDPLRSPVETLEGTTIKATLQDLNQLAAGLTAQEALLARKVAQQHTPRKIESTLRAIRQALTERFEEPMKTPELAEKHKTLALLQQDPLYAATYRIHTCLYRVLYDIMIPPPMCGGRACIF